MSLACALFWPDDDAIRDEIMVSDSINLGKRFKAFGTGTYLVSIYRPAPDRVQTFTGGRDGRTLKGGGWGVGGWGGTQMAGGVGGCGGGGGGLKEWE